MTTDSGHTYWTVARLLDLFDVEADGPNRFIGRTGVAGEDERQVAAVHTRGGSADRLVQPGRHDPAPADDRRRDRHRSPALDRGGLR